MVPDLDRPVSTAGDEDLGVVVVPVDLVDGHVVGVEGVQELAGVGLGALVDLALLRAHQEQVVRLLVEVKASATACGGKGVGWGSTEGEEYTHFILSQLCVT